MAFFCMMRRTSCRPPVAGLRSWEWIASVLLRTSRFNFGDLTDESANLRAPFAAASKAKF